MLIEPQVNKYKHRVRASELQPLAWITHVTSLVTNLHNLVTNPHKKRHPIEFWNCFSLITGFHNTKKYFMTTTSKLWTYLLHLLQNSIYILPVSYSILLTFILRGSYSVFGFTLLSFPLNRCACLTISVYILWTEGDEIMK